MSDVRYSKIELFGESDIVPHLKITIGKECSPFMDGIGEIVIHDCKDGRGWRICSLSTESTTLQRTAKRIVEGHQHKLDNEYEKLVIEEILLCHQEIAR